jgi:regulatory protein
MEKIKTIEYREHHLVITLESGRKLPCSYDILSSIPPKEEELDQESLDILLRASSRYTCRQKSLSYLAIRSRSTREMRIYLKKKSFPDDIIDETIIFLTEKGYLDDYDFALSYCKSRMSRKVEGQRMLRHKLMEKGVAGTIIDRALDETGARNIDPERIRELAEWKLRTLKGKPGTRERLYRFLMGRGFLPDEIRDVLKGLDPEIHDPED